MKTINVESEIVAKNREVLLREDVSLAEQKKLDQQVDKILLKADAAYYKEKTTLLADLGFDYKLAEAQRIRQERETFAHLPQDRIMSLEAIKATCLQYGLRFLPTRFYKGALDEQIGTKLDNFRVLNRGELPVVAEPEQMLGGGATEGKGRPQFYIAAPSSAFVLQPIPRDPLLFCRLSNLKYYLLHKWGDDLTEKDTQSHDVREHNWNSRFEEKDVMNGDYHRAVALAQQQVRTVNVPDRTTNSFAAIGGVGQWFQTTANNTITFSNGIAGISTTGSPF